MTREEEIKELCEWLEQMIQHGVPDHSAKRKALAYAISALSAEHKDCTDFLCWLLEEIMDEENWEINAEADGEIIARKLKKLGLLDSKDGYYIRTPMYEALTEPSDLLTHEEAWNMIDSDLISRADARRIIRESWKARPNDYSAFTPNRLIAQINELPSVSAERVGEWIPSKTSRNYICSSCGNEELVPTCMGEPTVWRYCPWCGARMENKK